MTGGRWQDAYLPRCGKRAVHLAGDSQAQRAICGSLIKPWTRPDPTSAICPACLVKAHRPHRNFIAKVRGVSKRKGAAPGAGQVAL